ncbi:MAG: class I SAM-dependent methyltransferase [Chitinophagaceae bacterium]
MMELSLNLHTIEIGSIKIDIFVPAPESIRQIYTADKISNPETPFPFWAKIWPSAFALAEYLNRNQNILKGKMVLELAGGLGLPSMVASHYAERVCCSDYLEEAVAVVRRTVLHNRMSNIDCAVYDWYNLPDALSADVLLLSDINYEPEIFDQLMMVCEKFLLSGTTIILSTPGRIMAKEFISRIDKWVKEKFELATDSDNPIYIFLLHQ